MAKWKLDPEIRRAASSGPEMLALVAIPLIERFGDEEPPEGLLYLIGAPVPICLYA